MAEKPDKDGVKPAEAEAQSPATPAPSPGSGLSRKERPHVRESVRPRAAVVYEIIQSSATRRSAKKSTRNARRADAQDFLAPPESRFSPLYKSSGEKRRPWSSG